MSNVNRSIIKKIKKNLVLKEEKFLALRKKYSRGVPSEVDFCGDANEILTP
jgi:hypothetical protein